MRSPECITPELLGACRRGDEEAIDQLVNACLDRVYSLALHLSGSDALAGDIAQDVFVKILTRITQFRHEAEFTTWLYRIVANTAIDYHRAERRLITDHDAGKALWEPPTQERDCLREELSQRVREALVRVAPCFRIPLVLRYVEGLSYDEIANVLRVSPGTVASRLSRGLGHLGRELRDLAPEMESS